MKKLQLNHPFTPPEISAINEELQAILQLDDIDTEELLTLIDQRHECVLGHLEMIQGTDKVKFSKAELAINEKLEFEARNLFNQSNSELVGLVRSRKAIKHYKK